MEILNIFYILITALAALLISITIWSRRPFKWRISAFFIGLGLIALLYIAIVELLSRPKPAHMELFYKDVPEDCFVKLEWERNGDAKYVEEKLKYAWKHRKDLGKKGREWYLKNCTMKEWIKKMNQIIL